mmetsp:Transcript_6791/g.9915  ORF Transcript_6791/g.9915 Transcript_6791/m.9915 type:complete len:95 (-) Transcript_6791:4-288(-)
MRPEKDQAAPKSFDSLDERLSNLSPKAFLSLDWKSGALNFFPNNIRGGKTSAEEQWIFGRANEFTVISRKAISMKKGNLHLIQLIVGFIIQRLQ